MSIKTRKNGPNATGRKLTTDELDNNWLYIQQELNRTVGPTGPAGNDGANGAVGATGPAGALPATFPEATFDDRTGDVITHAPGKFYFADGSFNVFVSEPEVTLQVGEEIWVKVRNNTGSTILNGSVVWINGSTGQNPTVALADASTHISSHVVGFATHDIENNTIGYVTISGRVNDIDTSAFSAGDEIFLDSTPGGITNVPLNAPTHRVSLGTVIRANTNGSILVSVDDPVDLNDITEVLVTNPQDHDRLTYDAGQQAWINSPPQDLAYETHSADVLLNGNALRIFADSNAATAGFTITLPATPIINTRFQIIEIGNNVATNPILVDGNGKLMNGSPTFSPTNYGVIDIVYNGTFWSILNL